MRRLAMVLLLALSAGAIWMLNRSTDVASSSTGNPSTASAEALAPMTPAEIAVRKRAAAAPDDSAVHWFLPEPITPRPVPAPLPPIGAPLGEYHDELARRAAAGDLGATCRLAYEIENCRRLPALREAQEAAQEALAQRRGLPDDAALERLAATERHLADLARRCDDVDPAWERDAFGYLLTLAKSGNADAAVRFALSPPLEPDSAVDRLEDWQHYRDYAMPMLGYAAARGDSYAMYNWALALTNAPVFAGSESMRIHDPAQSIEYNVAVERILTPDQSAAWSEAREKTRRWLSDERYQAAVARGQDRYTRFLSQTPKLDLSQGNLRPDPETRCDDP